MHWEKCKESLEVFSSSYCFYPIYSASVHWLPTICCICFLVLHKTYIKETENSFFQNRAQNPVKETEKYMSITNQHGLSEDSVVKMLMAFHKDWDSDPQNPYLMSVVVHLQFDPQMRSQDIPKARWLASIARTASSGFDQKTWPQKNNVC